MPTGPLRRVSTGGRGDRSASATSSATRSDGGTNRSGCTLLALLVPGTARPRRGTFGPPVAGSGHGNDAAGEWVRSVNRSRGKCASAPGGSFAWDTREFDEN